MGVIMDTNYRITDSAGAAHVGWSLPTATQPLWPYQRIARQITEFRQAGFTAVKLFPSCRGGAGIFSAGYDKNDDYDLDGTAYGSAEMLRQCIATIHAHQMQAYGDLVLHQYGGGNNGVYNSRRFPKHPSCFVGPSPRVPVDPIPDATGNFAFGDMAAYVNSTPAGYMHAGAIAAAQYLIRTTGFDGLRIDDVKGTNAQVIYDLLTAPGLQDLYGAGEYFDGQNEKLAKWVNEDMRRRAAVLDFGFKFNVGSICNNSSRSWMGALANIGYVNVDPAMAVTFIESADSDNSDGQRTIWNKALGYALLLTFPGYPMVYYRDWATDPQCYGMKRIINNLVWIHENFANGDFVPRLDTDPQVFVHERVGYNGQPGCVCFFNNDQYNAHTRTVQTDLGAYAEVHEYSGLGSVNNIWTDGQGRLTATVPPNNNGLSYLIYARPLPGGGAGFGWTPQSTRQTFYCASDLGRGRPEYGPLMSGERVVGQVDIAAGSAIELDLSITETGWQPDTSATLQVIGPDGRPAFGRAKVTGWHKLLVSGHNLPQAGSDFDTTIRYTAPSTPS